MTNDDWKWEGYPGKSDTGLSKEQGSFFGIEVIAGEKCIEFTNSDIRSQDCSGTLKNPLICVKNAAKLKINVVSPDHNFGTFTCPTDSYPEVPAGTLMQVGDTQPELMCPGKKVGYECNAGGINVRQVKILNRKLQDMYKNRVKNDIKDFEIPALLSSQRGSQDKVEVISKLFMSFFTLFFYIPLRNSIIGFL